MAIKSESLFATKTKRRIKLKPPNRYVVIMLNDDYTTMDFVVDVLVSIFKKTVDEATRIMLDVHQKGSGVCGTYSKDIADGKAMMVHERAREAGYPLRCVVEKETG